MALLLIRVEADAEIAAALGLFSLPQFGVTLKFLTDELAFDHAGPCYRSGNGVRRGHAAERSAAAQGCP